MEMGLYIKQGWLIYLSMSSLMLESECSKDASSSSKEKDSSSSSQEFPRIDALVNKINVHKRKFAGF